MFVSTKDLRTKVHGIGVDVGMKSLKLRHDITKLDLTIPLLFFWCIDIDLNIQTMSLTLNESRITHV